MSTKRLGIKKWGIQIIECLIRILTKNYFAGNGTTAKTKSLFPTDLSKKYSFSLYKSQ